MSLCLVRMYLGLRLWINPRYYIPDSYIHELIDSDRCLPYNYAGYMVLRQLVLRINNAYHTHFPYLLPQPYYKCRTWNNLIIYPLISITYIMECTIERRVEDLTVLRDISSPEIKYLTAQQYNDIISALLSVFVIHGDFDQDTANELKIKLYKS